MRQTLDKALDWNRFLALAEKEALTEPGKVRIQDLAQTQEWAKNVAAARLLQQEVQEITPLLDKEALWGPLGSLTDPSQGLESLLRGGTLELETLGIIRSWLYAIDSWAQIPREEIRGELFKRALFQIIQPIEALRIIEKVLTPSGDLSENASPRLSGLFSEIRSIKKEIDNLLSSLITNLSQKGVLQEKFHDVRDGRYVVPVKTSCQNDISGIIYEVSVSKHTVFIEPTEISPLNNRLRQRQNDLLEEIQAVLEQTSKALNPFVPETKLAVKIITHWDAVQARARHGRKFSGKPLLVSDERVLLIKQTAHPLLWWALPPNTIVRNDIDFSSPFQVFLITGPNTGGKTVLLKTIGLACLCARTGFPFPATDQPVVPFVDSVFADLGDPQSIEHHLSSFSGHVVRFNEILEKTTENSLILIDEINAATDPEEGAALGRAFLETVMNRGSMIVSTTHDPRLKALAISDRRILNASMAFDETSQVPTFRLLTGVPGRSRAIETAERLGMPKEVLDLARSYISDEHKQFESLLTNLENDTRFAAQARKEAAQLLDEAAKIKKEWTSKTELAVNDLLDRTRARLRRVLEQAQDEVRATVRKLDEIKTRKDVDKARTAVNTLVSTATAKVEEAFRDEAPELVEALQRNKASDTLADRGEARRYEFSVGETVRVPKWKSLGKILEIGAGEVKLTLGNLQMALPMSEIEPLSETEMNQLKTTALRQRTEPNRMKIDRPETPSAQLDIRGSRLEEAMSSLEHYIDQAFRSGGLKQVTIIHGLGRGALREGTRKILGTIPYIKGFKDAGVGQGGAGATVVEFDLG